MKISVVVREPDNNWYADFIKKEAVNHKDIRIEVLNIPNLNNIKELEKELGDVIYFRNSSLAMSTQQRSTFFEISKDKFIINIASLRYPYLPYKLSQQKIIEKYYSNSVNFIPTYSFTNKKDLMRSIKNKDLRFPFIAKLNLSSKGVGTNLIQEIHDNEIFNENNINNYVFQNFIKNKGDYRVFMIGGRCMGIMKRIAKEGSFLNNTSQGGKGYKVTDRNISRKLTIIGEKIATIFDLCVCGVDVIFNEEDKKYYFLEVNTTPQWEFFFKFTKINIGNEIINYCKLINKRKNKDLVDLVRNYYDISVDYLTEKKKFHYLSLLYFWTGDDKYKNQISEKKDEKNLDNLEKMVKNFIFNEKTYKSINQGGRDDYYRQFPKLRPYGDLLFNYMMYLRLYNIDLKPIIRKYVKDEEFLDLQHEIYNNNQHFLAFSSHFINYYHFVQFYLDGSSKDVDVNRILDIVENENLSSKEDDIILKIYLITHCVIARSEFYAIKIKSEEYIKLLKKAEELISENFFEVSLDVKFEFLVCCKICNFKPILEDLIMSEAKNSLSPIGNFLVDTKNIHASKKTLQSFSNSEHRNVLFIMANTKFTPKNS